MRIFKYLLFSLLFGIVIVISLVLFYEFSGKSVIKKNNFDRSFSVEGSSKLISSLDLEYNSYYIAGLTTDSIYLGNLLDPNLVVTTNYTLSDTTHLLLRIPENEKIAWKIAKVIIEYPNVFIYEGLTPLVLRAKIAELSYRKLDVNQYFMESVPTASSSFILKVYDQKKQLNTLSIATTERPFMQKTFPLERQVDGFFCTSGILIYNDDLGQVLYVYYYRNQFVALDANLNFLYKGNTIDTVAHANVKVGEIASENKTVLLNQPVVVNKHACTSEDLLFIHSGLKADNESQQLFDANEVIDVYSLKTHNYLYSFYVPFFRGRRLDDFKVSGNKIIALQDQFLVSYTIPTRGLLPHVRISHHMNGH